MCDVFWGSDESCVVESGMSVEEGVKDTSCVTKSCIRESDEHQVWLYEVNTLTANVPSASEE